MSVIHLTVLGKSRGPKANSEGFTGTVECITGYSDCGGTQTLENIFIAVNLATWGSRHIITIGWIGISKPLPKK